MSPFSLEPSEFDTSPEWDTGILKVTSNAESRKQSDTQQRKMKSTCQRSRRTSRTMCFPVRETKEGERFSGRRTTCWEGEKTFGLWGPRQEWGVWRHWNDDLNGGGSREREVRRMTESPGPSPGLTICESIHRTQLSCTRICDLLQWKDAKHRQREMVQGVQCTLGETWHKVQGSSPRGSHRTCWIPPATSWANQRGSSETRSQGCYYRLAV